MDNCCVVLILNVFNVCFESRKIGEFTIIPMNFGWGGETFKIVCEKHNINNFYIEFKYEKYWSLFRKYLKKRLISRNI